jgi:hypothetical protein
VTSNLCEALILLQDSSNNQGRALVLEMENNRTCICRILVKVLVQIMEIKRITSGRNGKRPAVVEILVEEVRTFNLISIILAMRWDQDPISLLMGVGMRGNRILITKVSMGSLALLMRVSMKTIMGLIKEVVLVAMRIIVSVVHNGHHIMGVETMVVVIVVEEGSTGRWEDKLTDP